MPGNCKHTTYKHGDDWGMVIFYCFTNIIWYPIFHNFCGWFRDSLPSTHLHTLNHNCSDFRQSLQHASGLPKQRPCSSGIPSHAAWGSASSPFVANFKGRLQSWRRCTLDLGIHQCPALLFGQISDFFLHLLIEVLQGLHHLFSMCTDLLHSLAGSGQCPEKACDGAASVSKKKGRHKLCIVYIKPYIYNLSHLTNILSSQLSMPLCY